MSDFADVAYRLSHWLAKNNITTENFTFIINIDNVRAACEFDMALRSETKHMLRPGTETYSPMDVTAGFELCGIKFRLESPIHDEPSRVTMRRFIRP